MRVLVNASLPEHDEKTEAILLYSEDILSVQADGKIKSTERRAYKILRPGGRDYGIVHANFDSETKIISFHGWCIPTHGKDYEVKDKDAIETSLFGVANGELVSDVRTKLLTIPAADPGSIVGYQTEHEDRPYVLQDDWMVQRSVPTREARYILQLPANWTYKAVWLNHPEVSPTDAGNNQWQWVVSDIKAIRAEDDMPPFRGIAGQMLLSLLPPDGGVRNKGFENWREMGKWQMGLALGRRDASQEIKQKVAMLTSPLSSTLDKMRALALFIQRDIRYVAIELGIGGWQPHTATEIFMHHFGDCKDKVTLLSSMLHEIGVESYYVAINTERGLVTPRMPAHMGRFDHMILGIRLPDNVQDASLVAVLNQPGAGRVLFFDPTDELTPFGYIRGELQSNYGLLVMPDGGDLLELPRLPAGINGIQRTAKLKLETNGTLSGEIEEVRLGDRARSLRSALRSVAKDSDRIKPIETLLAHSLTTFQITKASVGNFERTDLPLQFHYSFTAQNYAKGAGDLLLVRPRVVGSKSSDFLETKEPRRYSVEFDGPSSDTDIFEIALPAGFQIDDLPPPVSADYSFASYHSKAEAEAGGRVLRYTRTFEVKELSIPLAKVEELKKLYRIIASDERNTAVLKPTSH
ncbi:MAG: DUF3857 and transglutaminase domain-containing protein [Acidipila sp.]|nr:DUF3857 and transglutaminase domain-containing protein [Acidipila sp.]